ncbi:hypothetical protein Glove_30g101 [Diversispora epigaea]|uniref:Uncharacterized protein n=1 Tax=Diversispora epigaea TaxID=1348612 RepID=A0A397JRG7_9GLOM|nr:hypothetical protein Glove_30g101 [Diversispora epigaea]
MYKMYTREPEYNKETISSNELFKLPRRSGKPKIYNPKTNRMVAINGSAYNKLIRDGYIHWREERLLIPPFNEMLILRKCLSIVSNKIGDIVAEKSLLTKIDGKLGQPNALYDVFSKADVLGLEHILAIARMLQ